MDILVNNMGGVQLRLAGFLALTDADFEWAMQVNFFSARRATRAAVADMLKHGGGAIVNVASVNGFFQPDGATIDYGAAKAALLNLTKALAQEFGARARILAGIGGLATGRLTTPEEVATLVVLVASSRTANVTGSDFLIDGGLIKTL